MTGFELVAESVKKTSVYSVSERLNINIIAFASHETGYHATVESLRLTFFF